MDQDTIKVYFIAIYFDFHKDWLQGNEIVWVLIWALPKIEHHKIIICEWALKTFHQLQMGFIIEHNIMDNKN